MSADSPRKSSDTLNDEAINEVLRAERAAEQAVARCEQQARAILRTAQTQAQRIEQRGNERIVRMHMRCSQRLSEHDRLPVAGDTGEQLDRRDARADHASMAVAIETLAALLSGASPEEP